METSSTYRAGVPTTDNRAAPADALVRVRDLQVAFTSRSGEEVRVIRGVDFDLAKGEVLCFLGESGSGKSVTMRSLFRLLPPNARITGSIEVDGLDVPTLDATALRRLRGPVVSMIFQEPATALDPTFTIGHQITETIRAHEGVTEKAALARALDLMELVQIPSAARRLDAYPFELSGGLRQRAMIALALACRPKLLLADEPTTALDATVQIQVLMLLRSLREQLGMGVIIVTHDIGVACEIADRVAVMYAGQIVEIGPVDDIMSKPAHPYTRGLLRSVVTPQSVGGRLDPIKGAPPDLEMLPPGCAFAPRCPEARGVCQNAEPPTTSLGGDRRVRCLFATADDNVPRREDPA